MTELVPPTTGAPSTERNVVAVVCLAFLGSGVGLTIATVIARVLGAATLVPALVGTAIGMAASCVLGRRRLAVQLPVELDGWFGRRPRLRWLWIFVAMFAVANTARVGISIADPTQAWATAFPPMPQLAQHQCLAAYVRAGELAAAGQADLWNADDYARQDQPPTSTAVPCQVRGLAGYLDDAYEYPPTFALLPRAAVAATNDYEILRAAWYGISVVGFWLAFVAFAIWLRGRAGATSLLLAPAIAISFGVVLNLQFGQAHLLVVAASIAAMMLFARGRTLGGGALLGFAIASKIFPGLLLVHLAVRRQWRAIAATLAAIGAFVVLAAIVLGPATLAAFVSNQLPRMSSGAAFPHLEHNPDNYSLYGLGLKLADLGVEGAGRGLASLFGWIWGFVAVILTVIASRGRAAPARDAIIWLGIVCLATLRSPFAPTYTSVGTLWLFSVALGVVTPRRWLTAVVATCWVLLQGFPPVFSYAGNAAVSLPAQAVSIAVAILAVWPWPAIREHPDGARRFPTAT